MKIEALYFKTDKLAEWIKAKIESDGTVKHEGKTFNIADSNIALVKRRFGKYIPFVILKHDRTEPIDISNTEKSKVHPAAINEIIKMETLKTLARLTAAPIDKKKLILLGIIFFVLGFGISFVLFKVIGI